MSTREEPTWVTEGARGELACVVVERDDRPDRCTIYPRGAVEDVQSDRWLSATGEGFVDLAAVR